MPGFYRFDVTPYLREIIDCMGAEFPVREVSLMKGVQLAYTTGVLENVIGYAIDHLKTVPVMMVTADAELAKLRMESYITPMLQHSGLDHLIKSSDETSNRRTGKTSAKLEWIGGGFLIPFGAQNANKLRSFSIQYLLDDEIDGWPDVVGKDGDPIKLVRDRTAAFESNRKILDGSTPTIKGQSKIEKRYLAGDQRKYHVVCLNDSCRHSQVLHWRKTGANGQISGIVWDTDPDTQRLISGSVRYLCEKCGHAHTNDDKTRLLAPENGAQWIPTAVAASPDHRSYHLSALYSPPGMQTWEACVLKWLEAWDEERNCPRNLEALQVFYNNVLGEPFEVRGEQLKFENISPHRRSIYSLGQIPNAYALEYTASPILFLTCTVDVHKESLSVAVFGWCRDRRAFLIDYWKLEGDTEQRDNPKTWGALRELIEQKVYKADDGKQYRLEVTLIDSGYRTDTVYRFCEEYAFGVYAVKGVSASLKSARVPEFAALDTPLGNRVYGITVDLYKDRWSAALRHGWDGQNHQPEGHFNAPRNVPDDALKELTVEVKQQVINKTTKELMGFAWHRPGGSANELWDLLVYANAAHDMLAHNYCVEQKEMPAVDYRAFYDFCLQQTPFFIEPPS